VKTVKNRKQLYYKQAKFSSKTSDTLQLLLEKALKTFKVPDRSQTIYETRTTLEDKTSQEWLRLINSPRLVSGFQCGTLVSYSPGMHHMVISIAKSNEDELDVSKHPPPDGKRFMEAPLYFAVRDNHVVILQSMSLRADAFESHLNWLLQKTGGLHAGESVRLSDAIPGEIRRKIKNRAIKKITLQSPFFESQAKDTIEHRSVTSSIKAAAGRGLDILKGIIPAVQYDKLVAQDLTDVSDIQLNLEIKVVGRRRSDNHDEQAMRTLMDAIRHVDDPDLVRAEVEGIGTIKGSELRVHDYRNIKVIDGILDTADTYDTMCTWVISLVDNNRISGDH